jgi:hypothetical protein
MFILVSGRSGDSLLVLMFASFSFDLAVLASKGYSQQQSLNAFLTSALADLLTPYSGLMSCLAAYSQKL